MSKTFFSITEWIARFAYVNLLWLFFSIIGLVVFGFFPATVALFSIIHKWIHGETDFQIIRTFWASWKKEFLKSNMIGGILVTFSLLIWVNLRIIGFQTSINTSLAYVPVYLFLVFLLLTVLYLFPVYVNYDVPILMVMKNAFFIMLIHPLHTLMILGGVAVTLYGMRFIPGVLFFFGGSVLAYVITVICDNTFKRVELKRKAIQQS